VGTLESVETFAPQLRDEALVILILDFYHMMEYLHELSHLLYGKDTPWVLRIKEQWKEQMEGDEVQAVIDAMNKRSQQLAEVSAQSLETIHEKTGTWKTTRARCGMELFANQGSSTDRALWKLDVVP
jgi:hypothetical protein